MSVIPFRKPSPASLRTKKPRSIEERINGKLEGIEDLDLSQVMRIDGPKAADGSVQVTYSAQLELRLRQMVARYALPRLPYTAAELDALMAYAAYLEGCRADTLENNASWQRRWLALSEEHFPGYADGLRLFLAQNMAGLAEHHRTRCGYAELIDYAERYY